MLKRLSAAAAAAALMFALSGEAAPAGAVSSFYKDAVLFGTYNGQQGGFSSITDITGVSAVVFTFKVDEAQAQRAAAGKIDFKGTLGTKSSSKGTVSHSWSFVPYKLDSDGEIMYDDDLMPVTDADVTLEKVEDGLYTATLEDTTGLFKDEDSYASVWFDADSDAYDIELTGIVLSFDDTNIVRDLCNAKMSLEDNSLVYTGSAVKPGVIVTYGGKTLKNGTDYTLAYKNNKNVGTATVTAKGRGKYKGSITKTFTITKKSVKKAKVRFSKESYAYTGKAIKPAPTVTLGGRTLKKGTDYTLSFSDNKKVGKATVTVKGKGNYSGSIKATFSIVPAATKIGKTTSTKTAQVKTKWTKNTSADGYQVAYSTRSSFSSKSTRTVKGGSKTSYTAKKLKSGRTYYFKVRAYKLVNGSRVYGAFSKVKTVKVK
ncbi:MAG: fibronectin type III domain-containing protein [Ruminococcus sp.]|nr:fibronectin type III domain-containing protein [Ruminococcus sp.]